LVVTDPVAAEGLRPAWSALLDRVERSEVTQSPEWLLTWWHIFGRLQGRQLRLVAFFENGQLVGLAPLLSRWSWYGPIPLRRIEFLASGEREKQGIYSNHLAVLAEPGHEARVAHNLLQALTAGALGGWDELVLPMTDADLPMSDLLSGELRAAGLGVSVTEIARAPYLPLPATWDDYLDSLPRGHRRHITRSLATFEKWSGGRHELRWARTLPELAEGRRILIDLHHGSWEARQKSGVFRAVDYLRFHEAVMDELHDRDALLLMWLTVRGEPVAALYGTVWGDKVSAYQMGRRADVPAKASLGNVLLALAIRAAIDSGAHEFDFLADDAPYKMQMATAVRSLVCIHAVRSSLRMSARAGLEWCRSKIRAIRRRGKG
jgi:CelD/BcsL family acetyltransferase involved in cellulose biosynthesis